MRLAYFDRAHPTVMFVLPRKDASTLFPELKAEYVDRFFREVEGVGNIGLCIVKGNGNRYIRTFARRTYGGAA